MKKLKKLTARLLSLAVAAVTALSVGLNASAAAINYQWMVDRSSSDPYERTGWTGNGKTVFSVDDEVHTDNSWFSIKIENTDYNSANVERTYKVEPNTKYKFSALVKYSGFQLEPDADPQRSGANIGDATFYNGSVYVSPNASHQSDFTTSSNWTLLEYEFTTGNETTYNLCLKNRSCKGTAWFSDIKLEKAELTNNWNILAVFFKNADATVSVNGEQVHHKLSLRESDINDINTLGLDKLPEMLKTLSNNKMSVNSIDRYYIDEALTEKDLAVNSYKDNADTIPDGYRIDEKNSVLVSTTLDKYLAQKHYDQIIIFVPLKGIGGGWWGLGGTKYKGVHFAQISNSHDGAFEKSDKFQGQVVVHEITHGLEHDSKGINGDKTPTFHDILNDYPNQYPKSVDVDYFERIHQFLTCTLPDGRGVDPSVFYRPNGKYTLVDNDMTTGTGIEPGSSSVLPPAPTNFRAEAVSNTHIKFEWSLVPNAEGYEFVRFKNADRKENAVYHLYEPDRFSGTWGPYTIGTTYYYGIRTVATIDGKTVCSDWTYLTFTHAGAGIIHGDANNDGTFDVNDITAVINIIIFDRAADERTLAAIGVKSKSELNVNIVTKLINDILFG